MAATADPAPAGAPGVRGSTLRRGVSLHSRGTRLTVEPDCSVSSFYSLKEGRALFGLEQLWLYKVQAGIVVPAQRVEWTFRAEPGRVNAAGEAFGAEVRQTVEFFRGASCGFVRRASFRNASRAPLRLRVLGLVDPTAAHFGPPDRWGAMGVNAFNRESHVAMDEVSDPPSARVVGASPAPSRFYMTSSRGRAQGLISSGELPEGTAGMSGQALVLSCHELELGPGESRDLVFTSIYSPAKLEDALADFGRDRAGERGTMADDPRISCSDQAVAEAASWALAEAQAGAYSRDLLDRAEVLPALTWFSPELAAEAIAGGKSLLRRDGALPHAIDRSKPGLLESALFLKATAAYLALSQDKKLARAHYPMVKKVAGALMGRSEGAKVVTDPDLPQGWRRRLGRGYPTGEIPEVALALSGALESASKVSRLVGKPGDAGRFLERSRMVAEKVRATLLDERGSLSLSRDASGRLRTDETVDMAVAAFRHPFMASAEQAAAHRLFEKDFDTPYGPRTVPTSNLVYFNGSYGEGELGGVWTRAALAHAVLCYRAGLGGLGWSQVSKVARLVDGGYQKLGGAPGCFPHWIDVDGKSIGGAGSDPVAAGRFLEALMVGELGLPGGAERASLDPPRTSSLGWLAVSGFWAGGRSTAFVGRGGGAPRVFYSGAKLECKGGAGFAKSERVDLPRAGVAALSFHTPGQVICLGSSVPAPTKFTVSFPPRAAELARRLSTPLEAYDPAKGTWDRVGTLRVSASMGFEASLEANGWKAYRVSTP